MGAYSAALANTPRVEIAATRTRAGSVSATVAGYLGSAAFHNLAPISQQQYRRIFDGLRREHGDRSISTLERRHVIRMLDTKAGTPATARDFLRCLRLLTRYAISIGVRQDDPTAGVQVKMPKTDGFRTWTEEDITAFEAVYPVGTKERLALALLLNTATPPCVAPMSCGSDANMCVATRSATSSSKRPACCYRPSLSLPNWRPPSTPPHRAST